MSPVEKALQKLANYLENQSLVVKGDKLILGCSGGADSLAMLVLFAKLRYRYDLSLLVLHLNHQTRGAENEREAELVKKTCQDLNVPVIVRKIGPFARADFENQARARRIEEFEMIRKLYKFDKIVLGHHLNDQVETVLLNLFRGAGINGMSGIKPISGAYIHPLLDFTHAELTEVLSEQSIVWAEDPSNRDDSYRRNYLRNELIPRIREAINPAMDEKIARQARISYQAEQILRENSVKLLKKATLEQSQTTWILDLETFTKYREIERFYVLKRVFTFLSGTDRDFFWHSFEEISALLSGNGSRETLLQHGIRVRRIYDELHLSRPEPIEEVAGEPLILEEDRARAVYLDYRFTFKYLKLMPRNAFENPMTVYLDADKIVYPMSIRVRREGDRFMPRGMKDTKKLKDFFIDEKVPKFERDKMPIFCDAEKILWITGKRADQRACPDEGTTHYLQITAESLHEKPKRAASRVKKQGENDEFNEL